jgi:2',3'-cyclic-nucleotide 2'-phosphodiesterase (5'-nucleotidase family)
VDSGYFIADERNAHGGLRPDVVTRNDWVLKAYSQFPVDVFNVSSHDLRYFAGLLAKVEFSQAKTEPRLRRLVSANIVDEKRGSPVLRPFIVREVPSRQKGAKPVRVAFIGLTETTPAPPLGLKFIDPAEAARRTVPDARKVADIVVVLAKVSSQSEVARIAREAPGIDIILDGNAESLESGFTPPLYIGSTLIVFTPYETRMIGELRFYRNAQGKFTTRQRFVALDEILVPENPEAKQVVQAAAAAESETRANSKKLLEDWLTASRIRVTTRPTDTGSSGSTPTPTLVSSAACSQCHVAQYMKWANSAHAQATNPLPARVLEFEAGCLDCHATGANHTSAINVDLARLPNVQCEQCHGPGSNHVKNPGKGYGRVSNMKTGCIACHTSEISPEFDLQAAWAKIKH